MKTARDNASLIEVILVLVFLIFCIGFFVSIAISTNNLLNLVFLLLVPVTLWEYCLALKRIINDKNEENQ